MATWIWINTGAGNGLLPDGTKPLHEPILTVKIYGIHLRVSSQEMPKISLLDMSLKVTNLTIILGSPRGQWVKGELYTWTEAFQLTQKKHFHRYIKEAFQHATDIKDVLSHIPLNLPHVQRDGHEFQTEEWIMTFPVIGSHHSNGELLTLEMTRDFMYQFEWWHLVDKYSKSPLAKEISWKHV